jgi:hypothetical protein
MTNCPQAQSFAGRCDRKPSPSPDICLLAAESLGQAQNSVGQCWAVGAYCKYRCTLKQTAAYGTTTSLVRPAVSTALDLGHMHCFFIGQQALVARALDGLSRLISWPVVLLFEDIELQASIAVDSSPIMLSTGDVCTTSRSSPRSCSLMPRSTLSLDEPLVCEILTHGALLSFSSSSRFLRLQTHTAVSTYVVACVYAHGKRTDASLCHNRSHETRLNGADFLKVMIRARTLKRVSLCQEDSP